MSFLLEFMERRIKPLFGKKPLRALYPVYEAGETFLFTPADVTDGPPHVRDAVDSKRWMFTVVIALLPCVLFGIFNAGYQRNTANGIAGAGFWDHLLQGAILVLPVIFVSYAVGGFWEVLFACVRKHEINEGFLVTGLLFPLTLPPTIPLWQVAAGISFGVVIGKEIFGGIGYNILNPALTARAFLFFAYPAQISGDRVWTKVIDPARVADGFSGATPLAIAVGDARRRVRRRVPPRRGLHAFGHGRSAWRGAASPRPPSTCRPARRGRPGRHRRRLLARSWPAAWRG